MLLVAKVIVEVNMTIMIVQYLYHFIILTRLAAHVFGDIN